MGLSPSEAYRRVASVGEHRVMEAQSQYAEAARLPGLTHISGRDVTPVTADVCRIVGDDNYLMTGSKAHVPGLQRLTITGDRNIVFIGAHARYSRLRITITGDDNVVFIGFSSSGGEVHVVLPGCERVAMIGDECMLSSPITIGTENETSVFDAGGAPIADALLGAAADARGRVAIDDFVWIGRNVSISSGVRVGMRAVIGQCAVVTQDVPSGVVVAGAPASVLRRDIIWSRAIETDHFDGPEEKARKAGIAQRRANLVLRETGNDGDDLDGVIAPPLAGPRSLARNDAAPLAGEAEPALGMALNRVSLAVRRPVTLPSTPDGPYEKRPGLETLGAVAYSRALRIRGEGNLMIAAPSVDTDEIALTISGFNNIVYLAPHARLNRTSIQIRGSNNVIYVGRGTTLDDGVQLFLDGDDATFAIGDDCAIGVGAVLANSQGFLILDDAGAPVLDETDVRIGDHVMIGPYVRIHNGARIGDGAVLAGGAWVGGTCSAGALYAGSPASMARPEVTWRRAGAAN